MMGVSEAAVSYAVRDGRVPTLKDGTIDPVAGRRAWIANTDQSKPRNVVTGRPKGRRAVGAPPSPGLASDGEEEDAPSPGSRSYAKFRAAHEGIKAKIAELELRRLMGDLVELDSAGSQAFTVFRRLRDQFLAIPPRLAPLVATMTNADEIENAMFKEIHSALNEVAGWKPKPKQ